MKKAEPALLALFLFMLTGCEDMWNHCVDGNGDRTNETRELDAFGLIQVNGDFEVQVDTGPVSSAFVEADENLLDYIVTHVSGDKLIIEPRNGSCLRPTHPIEIKVTTPVVHSMELNGSGYLYCFGLQTDELLVRLSGSGRVECYQIQASSVDYDLEGSGSINSHVTTENLVALVEGSGEIRLNGSSVNSDLRLIGSGRIRAGDLNTGACVAYISGSGTIETDVDHALDVTIIGSGNVYYSGDPVVESYISGSGKVIKQ
jgi:hypothetical protein